MLCTTFQAQLNLDFDLGHFRGDPQKITAFRVILTVCGLASSRF